MSIVTNTANATYKYKSKNFSKSATSDFDIIDNVLIFTKQFVPKYRSKWWIRLKLY